MVALLATILLGAGSVIAWNNGVQKTPAMGFNTWNRFACNISSELIRETASTMKTLGFLDAGYTYINIDDCWLTAEREADGTLQVDSTKFPEGMNNLTSYLHGLGFKAGIYEDEGTETCAGFAGSLGYEAVDARSFVDWGFDYAKIDNCNSGSYSGTNQDRFTLWHDAQVKVQSDTGKVLFYSFVEWQSFDAWVWGPAVANSWRMYDDIQANWPRITGILNNASFIGNYSNFYGHNDLDMLENGNGDLTLAEQRSHFTAWALNKSPLLIGTDFSALSNDSINILLNSEVIAINQDQNIGEPLVPFFWGKNPDGTWDPDFPAQYWSGYVNDTSHTAIMYINFNPQTVDLNFTFSHSPHLKATSKYTVRDLWAHEDLTDVAGDGVDGFFFSGEVESHDVRAFLFTEV
ncbi:glycoside hydrolase family 27 protein [Athelia psychrophila]|uniref:Alpha-galactosidase n=1 Tax=Athelia psychrophila TaxID=1759441 RepID=A0A166DD15_9AGAM|nr:glycoside hydrolase family 27 protein [Fibularhizoctonia sp. CBS 109695]